MGWALGLESRAEGSVLGRWVQPTQHAGWVVSRTECSGSNEGNMEAGVEWDTHHMDRFPQTHPLTHCAVWTLRLLQAGLLFCLDGLRGLDPLWVSRG